MTAHSTPIVSTLRRRLTLAGAAWPLLPGCAPVPRAPLGPAVTLPMQLLRSGDIGGLPSVVLSLRGQPSRWLVATGASQHLVSRRLAAAQGLSTGGPSGALQGRPVSLPALAAGGQTLDLGSAIETDLDFHFESTGERVDGVIGLPAFLGITVRIDYAAGSVQFDAGAAAVAPVGTSLSVPLSPEQGSMVVALALGTRAAEQFMLDTGHAGALFVYPRRAQALRRADATVLPLATLRGIGAEIEVAHALLQRIRIGDYSIRHVPALLAEYRSGAPPRGVLDRWSGALGSALFESGSLHIDLAQRRLTVEWPDGPPVLPGGFGFGLRMDGDRRIRIGSVLAGSPASRGEMRPGDELIALDDQPLAGRTPSALWGAMRPAQAVRLALDGVDGPRRVELSRERFFPPLA